MTLIPARTAHKAFWMILLIALFLFGNTVANELDLSTDQFEPEEFSLRDIDGQTHRLSDYAGSVIILTFWATWCPECIYEMPSLEALSNTLPRDRFFVLAINVGEEREKVKSYTDKHHLTFTVLLDIELKVYKQWPVLGVPTSFVIDQQGEIVYSVIGAVEWTSREIGSRIRALHRSDQNPKR